MLNEMQQKIDSSLRQVAESNLIKKLNAQGISRSDMSIAKFEEVLAIEIDILKADGIKFGAGIAVGAAITLITGGLF